jgi:S1-C subfamily serine protease
VQVVEVMRGSPAALAGITPGDVVVQVNNQPVDSVESCNTLIQSADPSEGIRLQIRSLDGGARFIILQWNE